MAGSTASGRQPQDRSWLRRAFTGSGPPTSPFGIRAQPSRLDDAAARAALGLALRIGETMLAVGGSAADVTATILRVAASYGLGNCQADVTFTSLTVSYDRDDAPPITMLRMVSPRGLDYTRLQGITDLAREVGDGALDVDEAHARLDRVVSAPHPYRRVIHSAGWSGVAGSVAASLGGGWLVVLIAAVTTAVVAQLIRALDRRGLPLFFQQVVGAAVATGTAVLLVVADVPVRSSLVVAAGLVVLLAGLSLVSSAEDAISGFPVTAAARAFEVLTLTAGIVVGIAGALDVAQRARVPLTVVEASAATVSTGVGLLAAAGIAASWAVASYARLGAVGVATAAGVLSWTVYLGVGLLGTGSTLASGAAAVVIGFCGELLTDRLRVPPLLVAVCGIVPLLPGLAIYQGLFAIVVQDDIQGGLGVLVGAAATGLALAAGVSLGKYLGRPLRSTWDRFDRRVRRRATTLE